MNHLQVYITTEKVFKTPNEYWFNDILFLDKYNEFTKHCYLLGEYNSVLGYIAVTIVENECFSPAIGTFAGFDCVSQLTLEEKDFFVKGILAYFNTQNFTLRMPPYFLLDNGDDWNTILKANGFEEQFSELNYHFDLSENIQFHLSSRRRLHKCLAAGFKFEQWSNPNPEFCHQFISEARRRKGYPMSMSLQKFVEMLVSFSDRYFVFRVLNSEKKTIALSVVVKINDNILYNFYPADDENYLNFSPSVMLHHGIIEYAKVNHFKYFDLGIATDKGVRNEGLITFKKHLGAIEDFKKEYFYNLSKIN